MFKIYLQLSIPISIQNVAEFGETKENVLTALTSIWKTLSSIDQHTVILTWHPKVEDTLRPLRASDFLSTRQSMIDTLNFYKWDGLQRIQRHDSD